MDNDAKVFNLALTYAGCKFERYLKLMGKDDINKKMNNSHLLLSSFEEFFKEAQTYFKDLYEEQC